MTFPIRPPLISAAAPVAPGHFKPRSFGHATLENKQHLSQFRSDWTGARSYRARSHAVSFAVSIAAHAVALAAILYFAPALSKPHTDWILAYLLDVRDGSSGLSMRAGAAAALPTPIRSDAGPLLISATRRKPHHAVHASARISHSRREYEAKAHDAEAASLASRVPAVSAPAGNSRGADSNSSNGKTSAGSGGNSSSGSGSGPTDDAGDGDGTSIAHADYGNNPPPPYPAIARRREQQGTVTLRVLVGIDGLVQRAEIAESSGFDALDDSAIETVRRRWRFVPAQRAGTAIESWVLVPIRFALTEANASK